MVKGKRTSTSGRGSAEAIEKRRVARQLNALFGAGNGENGKRDGRTEKRRQRLLKELKEGRAGQALKPIELISHANELLSLGETLTSIRKNGVPAAKDDASFTGAQLEAARRTQSAYGFRPEVWKLLGIDLAKGADEAQAKRPRAQRA